MSGTAFVNFAYSQGRSGNRERLALGFFNTGAAKLEGKWGMYDFEGFSSASMDSHGYWG